MHAEGNSTQPQLETLLGDLMSQVCIFTGDNKKGTRRSSAQEVNLARPRCDSPSYLRNTSSALLSEKNGMIM